ncbi:MAG: C25 family cysteine peptidase [Candidatus Cloacimonas sp.]|nr:C25 family cysteine peptidase [Candidatus Cloacimonas sp.]
MKHVMMILILVGLIATLSAGLNYQYNLTKPTLKTEGQYTSVRLDNAQSWGEAGNPDLPWFGVKLLLPVGSEADKIVVSRKAPITYKLSAPISPIQKPYPFSHKILEAPSLPNESIYASVQAYPATPDNGLITAFLSGNPIAFSAVSPFEYYPAQNELVFYQQISVDISYSATSKAQAALRFLKQDAFTAKRLRQSVDNAGAISISRTIPTGVEYLIVADAAKLANWVPLQNLYESRGMTVMIKSMTEIIASSTGADTQDKLRNYISTFYAVNPLRYVLLAGDTDVIPHRGFYVNMGSSSEMDADIPADMYYSCLDGNWNTDGDANWGEMYEADLAPELAISRICYNSDTEIANQINKIMSYQIAPVESEIKTAFMAGEWLWDGPTWAGDYMDEMLGGSSANGYTTVGIPSSWNVTTLYDRTYGAADSWGANQIRPILSQGANLVNHLGHSNTTYTMRLSNNQVSASTITNDGSAHNYSIYFTQGCYSGAFDNRDTEPGSYTSDCISEKMTSIATAAAGMIAHSRYGWGSEGSTDGPSQYFHRQYMDAIFGEHINELGYTLVDSKIDNIPYMNSQPVMYWVAYETNLFGCPAMMIWSDTPQTITASLPSQWMVGVNSYQIPTNAPFAELIIKNAEGTIYQTLADADGLLNISMLESLNPGPYQLYLNAPNFYAYENTIMVTASQMPYIVCKNIVINDSDGLHHTGETVSISLYAKNVGLLDLNQAGTISLSSNSPNIQILNSTIPFSAIAAGDSLVIENAFQLNIIGNFVDNSSASLNFAASYDSYNSQSTSTILLNAPHLQISSYSVNNETTIINPGQSPSLSFSIQNTGSGNAFSPMLVLFSDSPYVSLSNYELQLTPIGFASTANYDSAFTVNISPAAELGSSVSINYLLGAENGESIEGNFIIYVGMMSYGFEPDLQSWEVQSLNANFTNQWHRSSSRNHTENGLYSMKFGGAGSAQYTGSAYGALLSPVMTVSPNCQLKFYHWMQAEKHATQNAYAWDGGMIQMSLNGSAWAQITPVGGYPYKIYSNNASPFAANTFVYSGDIPWTEAIFQLGNVSGTAQFRWVFGSDSNTSGEGWYVDDVHIDGIVANSDENLPAGATVQLHENYPNPFNPSTTLSFTLPAQTLVKLEIFNLKGQKVRSLIAGDTPQGTHNIVWNGTDDNNHGVASGVYYYRLSTPQSSLSKKMLLVK